MPGKYFEFVKSGRYAVPVEIAFLPTTCFEEITGKEVTTTKWAERSYWKEIKGLLKSGVDSCRSFSNIDGSPRISFGEEIGLGYVCLEYRKDKFPFMTVLDVKKNCWTDDEKEDEFDELDELAAGLRDYGGSHKSHVITKAFVKACVMKRTSSTTLDSKKLKKELGVKGEDLRNYLHNTSPSVSTAGKTSSLHEKEYNLSKRFSYERELTMNMESHRQYSSRPLNGGISNTYYEEKDDEDDSEDDFKEVDLFNGDGNNGDVSDDNFSLPDIDAPQSDIQEKQDQKEAARREEKKRKVSTPESGNSPKVKKSRSFRELNLPYNVVDDLARPIGTSEDSNTSNYKKIKKLLNKEAAIAKEKSRKRRNALFSTSSASEDKESIHLSKQTKKERSKKNSSIKSMSSELVTQERLKRSEDYGIFDIPKKNKSGKENPSRLKQCHPLSPSKAVNGITQRKRVPGTGEQSVRKKKSKTKSTSRMVKTEIHKTRLSELGIHGDTVGLEMNVLQAAVDPDMPVLLPEIPDDLRVPTTLMKRKPKLKQEVVLPEKNKKKLYKAKERRNKSSTKETQTPDDYSSLNLAATFGELSLEKASLDTNPNFGKSVAENFVYDGNLPVDGVESISATSRTAISGSRELIPLMPPPSRPAPRTPKKSHLATKLRSGLYNPTHGFSLSSFIPQSQSDPSKLSTIQLMCHPNVLPVGLEFVECLTKKTMSAKQIGRRLGFVDLSKDMRRKKRELSPDITALPQLCSQEQSTEADYSRKSGVELTISGELDRQRRDSEQDIGQPDEDLTEAERRDRQLGENVLIELLHRVHEDPNANIDVEPMGYEHDLSQRSLCFLHVIPGYSQKSHLYKLHCSNVTDLTFERLLEHYIAIRPALRQIFEGEVTNVRSNIYLQGQSGKSKLQEMSVSVPFDHDQTSSIITLLLEYFIPDKSQRPKWSDYISYVLLPEALINIYARVNDMSYETAEKEMRFRACYDD